MIAAQVQGETQQWNQATFVMLGLVVAVLGLFFMAA